jgi:acetyl-CoA carboxylase biotin carboxyl carrier protein
MSKGGKPKDVFDIERVRQIIELMEQHDLSEVDLEQGDEKIKLKRGVAAPVYAAAPMVAPAPGPPQAHAAVAQAAAASAAATSAADTTGTVTINAPMVGTFYCRANPDSEPFVKVGDRVTDETIVCIVEAMKVFNEIPAECSGKIVEILINDQETVDFGKPMFRVQVN